jgi:hypothetical protein
VATIRAVLEHDNRDVFVLSLGFYHIDACLLSPGCELIHRCEARLFGTLDASEMDKVVVEESAQVANSFYSRRLL